MTLEDEVTLSQRNAAARERLIEQNMDFIRRCASRAAGRFVDSHDDACSEAMIAFNDAITAYRPDRGAFHPFAAAAIHNRVTDLLRRESRSAVCAPFSAMPAQDVETPFEVEDPKQVFSDAAFEIAAAKQELGALGVDFFELPKASPKAEKTKAACMQVIGYLLHEPLLLQSIRKTACLPGKTLMQELGVNSKVLPRGMNFVGSVCFLYCISQMSSSRFACAEMTLQQSDTLPPPTARMRSTWFSRATFAPSCALA